MTRPHELLPSQTPIGREPAAARTFGRAAHGVVGVAAALLVLLSAGGYFYHRNQLLAIAAEHVRLIVTGPDVLHAGVASEYLVSVTAVNGRPLPAQIEAVLSDAGGQRLKAYKESADARGRLRVLISGELKLPPQVVLKVAAQHGDSLESAELPLRVLPSEDVAYLTTDRPFYAPGEPIRYRCLTLSRFALTADHESSALFEVLDPQGRRMPQLVYRQQTEHGVASGAFSIPLRWPAGQYALAVHSPDGKFAERRAPFAVRNVDDENADDAEPSKKTASPKIRVVFQPENGRLIAGQENRVYFLAQDARGRPIRLSGTMVADDDRSASQPDKAKPGKPKSVEAKPQAPSMATVRTTFDGMGAFSFTPEVGKRYCLKIIDPVGVTDRPALPAVSSERPAATLFGDRVFAAGQPLECNLHTDQAGLPLVVAAYCRGVQVGQQPLVSRAGANPVSIAMPTTVGGVMQLAVFSYASDEPKLLAQRCVYRRPAGWLNVHTTGLKASYAPGEKATAVVSVTNERGEPAAATLGIAVGPYRVAAAANCFLLTDEVQRPWPLPDAGFFLSEGKQGDVSAPAALDLLLGVQPPSTGTCRPPRMFDNLSQIRANYQKSLSEYQADRTRVLNTLTIASFLGGLGLVLLVAMLGLMQIVSGLALWVAAIGATTCCLIIGAILMDPIQQGARLDTVVAFTSHPTDGEKTPASEPGIARESPPFAEASDTPSQSAESLYWNPLLLVGSDGKASLDIAWPETAATFFATIDAHGSGRLGASQTKVVVEKKKP